MDIGCGMGFFTIPMSCITGSRGKVIAVDLQPEMLDGLQRNARKSGCENIVLHQCAYNSLNIRQWDNTVDFALVFMMLHEVPDAERLVRELCDALAPGGKLLFAEPVVHVSHECFHQSVSMIEKSGLGDTGSPKIPLCRSRVFQKPER